MLTQDSISFFYIHVNVYVCRWVCILYTGFACTNRQCTVHLSCLYRRMCTHTHILFSRINNMGYLLAWKKGKNFLCTTFFKWYHLFSILIRFCLVNFPSPTDGYWFQSITPVKLLLRHGEMQWPRLCDSLCSLHTTVSLASCSV